jgi:SAM-dependent methyltransferase
VNEAQLQPEAPNAGPDVYSLLTRKTTAATETRPPISVVLRQIVGHQPQAVPTNVHNLDDALEPIDVGPSIARDPHPIPSDADREGYSTGNDAGYWISGLRDYLKVLEAFRRHGKTDALPRRVLDLGCATGRVLRHMACQEEEVEVWGCDIDRKNVEWVARHLPDRIRIFQNSVYPNLPIQDSFFDVVTAFSVFTHIDTFEDAWLLELRRILRPGGIAFITFHSERVWNRIAETRFSFVMTAMLKCRHEDGTPTVAEEFARPMPADRLVLAWQTDSAYRYNAFHSTNYVLSRWGKLLEPCAVYDGGVAGFQDIAVLRKA